MSTSTINKAAAALRKYEVANSKKDTATPVTRRLANGYQITLYKEEGRLKYTLTGPGVVNPIQGYFNEGFGSEQRTRMILRENSKPVDVKRSDYKVAVDYSRLYKQHGPQDKQVQKLAKALILRGRTFVVHDDVLAELIKNDQLEKIVKAAQQAGYNTGNSYGGRDYVTSHLGNIKASL